MAHEARRASVSVPTHLIQAPGTTTRCFSSTADGVARDLPLGLLQKRLTLTTELVRHCELCALATLPPDHYATPFVQESMCAGSRSCHHECRLLRLGLLPHFPLWHKRRLKYLEFGLTLHCLTGATLGLGARSQRRV